MEKFGDISFYGRENEELQKEYERMFCNMTQEEKQLLLKDLCARLPYGVYVQRNSTYNPTKKLIERFSAEEGVVDITYKTIERLGYKPYLRPMSSMTKEEMGGYQAFFNYDGVEYPEEYIDWLNAHHFDYRGLIEKGLAFEATKDMYK